MNILIKLNKESEALLNKKIDELNTKQTEAEQRLEKRKKAYEEEMRQKKIADEKRQQYREQIYKNMEEEANNKKNKVETKIEHKETKLKEVFEKTERQRRLEIEMKKLKHEEREEEIKRLEKIKSYETMKQAEEIESEKIRNELIKLEKEKMIQMRKAVKLNSKLYQDQVREKIDAMKSKKFESLKVELNLAPELGNISIRKSASDIHSLITPSTEMNSKTPERAKSIQQKNKKGIK